MCFTWLVRCEAGSEKPLKVAVLLSGGVDSSLALHLLRRAGHHVTAFYLQIWFQEDFRNFWSSCPWEEDLEICRQVIISLPYGLPAFEEPMKAKDCWCWLCTS